MRAVGERMRRLYPADVTTAIVVALWAVASDQIVQIFENAMAPFLGGSL